MAFWGADVAKKELALKAMRVKLSDVTEDRNRKQDEARSR